MEASITLNCSSYLDNIVDIIKLFQQIGWDIYNPHGKVIYLPVGDDDMYDWQCEEISEIKLFDIISEKIAKKEQVGVDLFYNNSTEGKRSLVFLNVRCLMPELMNRASI